MRRRYEVTRLTLDPLDSPGGKLFFIYSTNAVKSTFHYIFTHYVCRTCVFQHKIAFSLEGHGI